MDENKLAEIATAEASRYDPEVMTKPFGYNWGHAYWGKWQTISYALAALGIPTGASILDVGMGVGWTTVFLAESGFRPTGIDIAPASAAIAKARANRCGVDVGALVADMDDFDLGQTFDAALVFDALHHSNQQAKVIRNVAQHIRPGGGFYSASRRGFMICRQVRDGCTVKSGGSSAASRCGTSNATAAKPRSATSGGSTRAPNLTPDVRVTSRIKLLACSPHEQRVHRR